MEEMEEAVDRISSLPNYLLCHILSFLPTIEAVATSTLSKRWEYVWIHVPVLDFTVPYSLSIPSFTSFVDRILVRNRAPALELVRFSFQKDIKFFHVASWVLNAMKWDVFEVNLWWQCHEMKTLPEDTFVSESVEVLKLRGWFCPFSGSVHLPYLSVLHLQSLKFTTDFSLKDLLLDMPSLIECDIRFCSGLQDVYICSSSLKKLVLIGLIVLSGNSESLRKTVIGAPCLEFLRIECEVVSDYMFDDMPSLVEAYIDVRSLDINNDDDVAFVKLLKQLPKLKIMHLGASFVSFLPRITKDDQLTMFTCLTHLSVGYGVWGILIKLPYVKFWWPQVLTLLNHTPNVTTLEYWCTMGEWTEDELPELSITVPECLSSTLRTIDIHSFRGTTADHVVLQYLLMNARMLKNFRIHVEGEVSDKQSQAIARLLKVPMASSVCQFTICCSKPRKAFV